MYQTVSINEEDQLLTEKHKQCQLLYTYSIENKRIAGSEECSPNANCLYMAELVIKHDLYTNTWQRKPPFMKKNKER